MQQNLISFAVLIDLEDEAVAVVMIVAPSLTLVWRVQKQ